MLDPYAGHMLDTYAGRYTPNAKTLYAGRYTPNAIRWTLRRYTLDAIHWTLYAGHTGRYMLDANAGHMLEADGQTPVRP